MTASSRRAERADRDRLLGIDGPPLWQCPHHLACICPPPAPAERCGTHGDYTPRVWGGECPLCLVEAQDGWHDWHYQQDHRY